MARGTWSEGEGKVRAGFYMRFIAAAMARVQPGMRGIVAIPVKANWGPPNEVVEIEDVNQLQNIYDFGGTAYKSIYLALLGQPKLVLGYRMTDGNEKVASVTLKDTADTDVIKVETLYPTTRAFNVSVKESLGDPSKIELTLFEGTAKKYTIILDKGSIDDIVNAMNSDSNNVYLKAIKVADGNGTLQNVSNQPLTGGNDGMDNITNQQYIDAMAAFEARQFDAFALDGATDVALQTTVASWTKRLRDEGKKIISFMGGSLEDDKDPETGNTRSRGFNHEGIVNVTVSAKLDGTWYSSAEVACYVAGLVSGQALNESATYAATPFDDVSPRLTNSQIISGIQAGSFLLVHDGEKVVCEKGINTLTSLRTGQNESFKKIKPVRIMDAIEMDTAKTAHEAYIGKIPNNDDGQNALLSAIKNYFETLAPTLIADDFVVEVDEEMMKNAASDEFYWKYTATIIDSMERIYGTGYVR